MAKRQPIKKKKASEGRSIFDLIKLLHTNKKLMWDDLTPQERKTFSNTFMVNKIMSMNPDYTDLINLLQHLTINVLDPESVWKLYQKMLPHHYTYSKYLKPSVSKKYNKEVMNYLYMYFEVSERELTEYLSILTQNDIIDIIEKYGYDRNYAKKLIKN